LKVGVLLAAGSVNLEAAYSAARVLEELGSKEVVIIHTTSPGSEENARRFERWLRSAGLKVERASVKSDAEAGMEERLKQLRSVEADVVVVSPGGASLAALASRAFERIAHVTFPFSLWNGLHYPYVPRPFQKVYVLGNVKRSFTNLAKAFPEELPAAPVRRLVAGLVRKLNEAGGRCYKVKVVLSAGHQEIVNVATDLCEGSVRKLAEAGTTAVRSLGYLESQRVLERGSQSLVWASGLLPIRVEPGKEYIADSSAIYLGALNLHVARVIRLRTPRCAFYEMIHKYEEGAKRTKLDVIGLISKYLVDEARGTEFPSPTDLCDKAFFQSDPLLIHDKVILTEDNGIKMMWMASPLSKLARVESPKRARTVKEALEVEHYTYPFALYGLLQFYAMLKLVKGELRELGRELFAGSVEVDGEAVDEI